MWLRETTSSSPGKRSIPTPTSIRRSLNLSRNRGSRSTSRSQRRRTSKYRLFRNNTRFDGAVLTGTNEDRKSKAIVCAHVVLIAIRVGLDGFPGKQFVAAGRNAAHRNKAIFAGCTEPVLIGLVPARGVGYQHNLSADGRATVAAKNRCGDAAAIGT